MAVATESETGARAGGTPVRAPHRRHRGLHNYLLIGPAYSIFGIFLVLPILAAIWYSFFDISISGMTWTGLANYRSTLSDPVTARSLLITTVFTALAVIVGMSIALAVALLLYPLPQRLRNSLRALLYLPAIIPIAATALIWKWLYNYAFGLLNYLLRAVGLGPLDWLGSFTLALPSVAGMVLATGLGATILIILAAIDGVPRDLIDAARVDGAGAVRVFVNVLLPLIKPALLYLVVIQTTAAFQIFAPFVLMTNGGPAGATTTLGYQVYSTAFERFEFGKASALAVLMVVIVGALAIVEFRLLRSDVEY